MNEFVHDAFLFSARLLSLFIRVQDPSLENGTSHSGLVFFVHQLT